MFSLQTIFGSGKQFYTYLDEAAQAAADSAKALHAMMREADRQPALDAFKLARLRERAASDKISQALVDSFMTPIEREDIEALGSALYKIPKQIEKFADRYSLATQHLALGRKVIVYHDYIKGGGTNPFDIRVSDADPEKRNALIVAMEDFNAKFGDLQRANLHKLPSPVELFRQEFDDLLLVNGQVKPKRSVLQAYKDFNDDSRGPAVMLVQSAKDKGWSGHDTTGKHQRVLINLGLPTAPTKAIQQEGRIYRTGNVSDAILRYLNTGTSWERTAFASTIATRAATAENLALGELARSLQDSFIQAFEESEAWAPGHEGEGRGGKEQDRTRNAVVSEWDRAKTLYWAQQKKTRRTKAKEGADYFATPEPLGMKMVEWGGVVNGEDTLEPSAGHGAIARWFPTTSRRTMVEPSPVLRSRLALAGFKDTDRIVADVFENLDIGNKYDVIAMNPPFGTASRTAVDHMAKAYRHLREGGRMVALLPTGPAADKKLEAWLYEKADKPGQDGELPYTKPELHRVADILLPGVAFGRAGTNVATRVVVIDKLAKDETPAAAHRTMDLSDAADIGELFDRLEYLDVPQRRKQIEAQDERAQEIRQAVELPRINRVPGDGQAQPAAAGEDRARPAAAGEPAAAQGKKLPRAGRKLVEHFTGKGKRLEGVIFEGSKEDAAQFDPYTFRKDGGWFIRGKHLADEDERPAFLRTSEEEAIAFALRRGGGDLVWRMERARLVVDQMMAAWKNALPVVVASNMQDEVIPQRVRDYDQLLKEQGATGEAAGFIYKGTVYVLSDQLATDADVASALAHEMLGHAGLRGAFGKGLDSILRQIAQTRQADMKRIATDYGLDLREEADRLHVAEEVLAFMAQTQPELGFVRRAIAAIATWLRAHVPALANMRMTDAEMIQRFILPARAYIENGSTNRQTNARGDDPAFLRVSPGQAVAKGRKTLGQLQQRVKDLTGSSSWDSVIYAWQDRFIDLKRIQQRIKDLNGTVNETNDAYQGEELYHKRVAKRTANFLRDELKPLLAGLNAAGVQMEEFERFLHARHAGEANRVLAERNPNQATIDAERAKADKELHNLRMQLQKATAKGMALGPIQKAMGAALMAKGRWDSAEAFKGTEDERLALSGMSDLEAQNILNGYPADKRAQLDALASQVDAINEGTLRTLQDYGLMDRTTLDAWRKTYQHYVPLHRDEAHPDSKAHPIGQGFSTKGDAAKQRTGSKEKVTHILSHIAMQREAAITRGEKNNVAKRLYVLASQNPDPDLWSLELPKKKAMDSDTGLVKTVVDRAAALKDNVLMVRIAGHDKHLVFNPKNDQALRLAIAMRNLDATELDRFTRLMGRLTRWFAAVNTQYNPVFSVFNFARDIQGTMLQLSTTPLAGQEMQVLKGVGANVRSIYRELRNQRAGKGVGAGQWAQAWEQLQMDGGMTGFRELYSNPKDRAEALQKALNAESHGRVRRAASGLFGWLSDFNETMEGTTRLAVYKVALDKGLSRQEAASIAKNITVNFNRRGRNTSVVGSYYAFMNAAIQGNVRMYETLTGPRGRQIMIGGVLLGMASAMAGHLVMGGDGADDEWARVPEFVKERNIVIPLGHKDYVSIPMPLGFHVFPNIGRKLVEIGVNNDPHKGRMTRVGELALIAINAYNPLGGTENLLQMVAPTPFDPVAALLENKDWTGKPVYKEQRSSLDPKPGHAMAKDGTSQPARWLARIVNDATGGNEWRPGAWSPNPDAIEYLFGQFTGGVGRELAKVGNMARAAVSGDELAAHQWPLLGRVYGNTRGINGQSETFYSNIQRINVAMSEAKGRAERGEDVQAILLDVPLAKLNAGADLVEKRVRDLAKMRTRIQKGDDPNKAELVKEVNEEIERTMYRLNAAVVEAIHAVKRNE